MYRKFVALRGQSTATQEIDRKPLSFRLSTSGSCFGGEESGGERLLDKTGAEDRQCSSAVG
jgi:hypothetical protein